MSIFINKNSKVLVLGFTGSEGTHHSTQMIQYGTNIVGGVTPGKGGMTHLEKPVFNTIYDAKKETGADVAIVFVPPSFAADSMLEAIQEEVELVICITEGIPVQDMVKVNHVLQGSMTKIIGPNCPGVITPNECKVGIMPGSIFKKGKIGIISKSGTLTYEAADQIVKAGLGISTAVGIGGDPIIGTSTKQVLQMFVEDNETEAIVMIGEIGGSMEKDASEWYKKSGSNKPVVGFIAGQTAPKGKRMGHAGAIVGGSDDSAVAKMRIMNDCGINVIENPTLIGEAVKGLF